MTGSAGFGDDPSVIDAFWAKVAGRVDAIKRGLLFHAQRKVVIATPVRFGVARGGWKATADEIDLSVPKKPPKGTVLPPPGAPDVHPTEDLGVNYWLTNNVVYIPFLNDGSSIQAPAKFVDKAIAEVEAGFDALVHDVVQEDGGL